MNSLTEPAAIERRPLRIAMFTDSYLPEINGVVMSITSYAEALRARGHTVTIVAPEAATSVAPSADVIRFASQAFPPYPGYRMAFAAPRSARRAIDALEVDIVHPHSMFVTGAYGAWWARRRGIPIVFTYHTLWMEYMHYSPVGMSIGLWWALWSSRNFCNRSTRVITPTARIRDILVSYGVRTPIDVLPSGLSVAVATSHPGRVAALRRERADAPGVLYAGRLGREKNLEYLVDAMQAAHRVLPALRLTIAGGGPFEAALRERIARAGLTEAVAFTGTIPQTELADHYSANDAFIFASTTETQGLVLLEAMAHGLPVVAYGSEVSREMVDGAGVVVEGPPAAFADALCALLADAGRRAKMAVAARERALPLHTDRLVEGLESIYFRAIADARR